MKELDELNKRTNRVCVLMMVGIALGIIGTILVAFKITLIANYFLIPFAFITLGCMFYHVITIGKFINILKEYSNE